MALMILMGANYHATGVNSGVYLNPIDPTDAIYKTVYPAQVKYLQQFVNCERSLIFQNLAINKQRSENQESQTIELVTNYNKMSLELDYVLEHLKIDPNSIGDPNHTNDI